METTIAIAIGNLGISNGRLFGVVVRSVIRSNCKRESERDSLCQGFNWIYFQQQHQHQVK